MFCRICGQSHDTEDNYCIKCGGRIRTGPTDAVPNGPIETKPPDQPAQNINPVDIFLPEDGIDLKKAVEDFERQRILQALKKTNWVKNRAASLLGLNRTTLVEKIKKLNIKN